MLSHQQPAVAQPPGEGEDVVSRGEERGKEGGDEMGGDGRRGNWSPIFQDVVAPCHQSQLFRLDSLVVCQSVSELVSDAGKDVGKQQRADED